jgi:hypothetical protein
LFSLYETVESSNKLLFSACVRIASKDDHDSDNLVHATFVFVFNSKHLEAVNTLNIRVSYEVKHFLMRRGTTSFSRKMVFHASNSYFLW